jgi:release factor glutamine methyltransferase
MSLPALIGDISARLATAGVPSPAVDAEFLVAHVAGLSRGELLAKIQQGYELGAEQLSTLEGLVERREQREPLQHLLGVAPFMSFEVRVGPGVFVPRPETESLAERAIQTASAMAVGDEGLRIVDLCAGSGVLAIALAKSIPHATVQAWEISDDALPYLRGNVEELAPEVQVEHASVETWASQVAPSSVDMVVSNPPYVPDSEIPNDREVQLFDPGLALYGGIDGLDVIRVIAEGSARALRSGGILMLEHSNLQGSAVRDVLESRGFRTVSTETDLVGRERFTWGHRP